MMLNSSSWFRPEQPVLLYRTCNLSCIDRSICLLLYIHYIQSVGGKLTILRNRVVLFQVSVPGKPTSDYLNSIFKLYCFSEPVA